VPDLEVSRPVRSILSTKRKTYARDDDGCLMVEISLNLFVEESIAERLGGAVAA
jgi:hypothetical protein